MKRLVDRFTARAGECRSHGELRELLAEACAGLGFTYFALLHHAALNSPKTGLIFLHNYPPRWVKKIASEKGEKDPIHLACRDVVGGFAWESLAAQSKPSESSNGRLVRCLDYGLGTGFTVPVLVPGEPDGSCSFAVEPGKPLPPGQLLAAELVGLHAFCAARTLIKAMLRPPRPHLSPRQRECLKLVARGKSDWEIAAILGISSETARQYVKSARAAYDVVSRTQLVVLGLRDNWLGFEEAIPPSG